MLLEAFLTALMVMLDQLSKGWVRENLRFGERRELLPGVLGLNHSQNTGAAFSSFSAQTLALTIVSAALVAALALYLIRFRPKRSVRLPLLLILAGGAGNLIDRVFFQAVTDFMELLFVRFAIFNLADVLIVCGAIWLVISVLLDGGTKDGTA